MTPSAGENTVNYLLKPYTQVPVVLAVPEVNSGNGQNWNAHMYNVNKNYFNFYNHGQSIQRWIVIGY